MGDQPPSQQIPVQVNITWPADTYAGAEPVNAFVFTDLGENLCFAFAFAPPPPSLEMVDETGAVAIEAQNSRAFLLPKSLVFNLTQALQQLIANNATLINVQENAGGEADADQP